MTSSRTTRRPRTEGVKDTQARSRQVSHSPGPRGAQPGILALQHAAGNHAVSEALERSAGEPLDPASRTLMESRFGTDFSQVRVHTGSQAEESASALKANAYTVGQDVVFGKGRYAPDTTAGKRLLAHELSHVVQQTRRSGGEESGVAAEAEADVVARQAAAGQAVSVQTGGGVGIQRQAAAGASEWKDLDELTKYLNKDNQKEGNRPISKAYGTMENTRLGKKSFHDIIGEAQVKPSSEAGGQQRGEVTLGELREIMPELQKVDDEKVNRYLRNLNEAFALMGIDTVESQALFLAHATIESKQLSQFTEAQKVPYLDKVPNKEELFRGEKGLEGLYPEKKNGIENKDRKTIDPIKDQWHFIGRGPVQVTHVYNYLQTLAVLQRKSDDLRQEAFKQPDAAAMTRMLEQSAKLSGMVKAIMKDPTQASNPEYTFLFSAAFAKKPWGGQSKDSNDYKPGKANKPGEGKAGQDPTLFDRDALRPSFKEFPDPDKPGKTRTELTSPWMTSGKRDPKGAQKLQAYQRAKNVLARKQTKT